MIYLSNFVPLYCPSCGTPTRFERVDNPNAARFKASQALDCPICGVHFQFADRKEILRAATLAGGDLLDMMMGDDPKE
ncbi:MAG: hypothetical protein DWQ07_18730 [Chloroflexi bacterium]|nr:MAG: hypothetical protein DWQ07_18730 [Chloroflexota bacterium]MBL1194968.1 hypothetical protein [Chloroflexota bacterium]NOH12258.1 hypothetical protein [Chloroflexota bacterium]